MNVAAGCVAIVLASMWETQVWGMSAYKWAYIFIGIAAVADFCDGLAARTLHAYSNLGKELDSLCDLVSFGVAPAMLVYQCFAADEFTRLAAFFAICIPVFGALRLAKFNIDDRQTTTFIGLPIPANAIFWIGLTALFADNQGMLGVLPVIVIIVLESLLMVSPLKMFSLKFKHLGWKGNEMRWVLAVAAVVSVGAMGVPGLMWLIIIYFLLSRLPVAYRA